MVGEQLSSMRVNYGGRTLSEETAGLEPLRLFEAWFGEVLALPISEPNAMALATSTPLGQPSVRTVLLKGMSEAGAEFYTNYESRKGQELASNPRVAAVMLWHEAGRQVRFEGTVVRLTAEQSDDYFMSRPVGSRISAIASPQSQLVADRADLEDRWQEAQNGAEQRPANWGGFLIEIQRWEFWQGGPDRLHDRFQFDLVNGQWRRSRLAP